MYKKERRLGKTYRKDDDGRESLPGDEDDVQP